MKSTSLKLLSLFIAIAMMLPIFPVGSIAQEENAEAVILSEAKDLRTSNEKHFYCSDGTIVAVQYDEAVHYLDQSGKWQDVDNTLVYDSTTKSYKNTKNPSFDVELTDNKTISLSGKNSSINWKTKVISMSNVISENSTVSLTPIANQSDEIQAGKKVSDKDAFSLGKINTNLRYSNSIDGITTSYTVSQNSVKEDVILSENLGYVNFVTEYNCSEPINIIVNEDGSLKFVNSSNEVIYIVDSPYLYDASGSVCNNVNVNVITKGTKSIVTYTPDKEWYTDPQRTYPITFDPKVLNTNGYSTTLYTNAYSYGGYEVNNLGTSLSVGYVYNAMSNEKHVYYKTVFKPLTYPVVDLDENEITNVAVTFRVSSVTGSGSFQHYTLTALDEITQNNTTFIPQGALLGNTAFSSGTSSVTLELPVEDYFDYYYGNTRYGFVAMTDEATLYGSETTAHVSLYGTSDYTKLPKITVTYTPKNIDNRYVFIENSEKYLVYTTDSPGVTLGSRSDSEEQQTEIIVDPSNPLGLSNPLMSIWLVKRHTNGSQMIVSAYDTTKVLSYDTSGNLSLISESSVTSTTNCFWNINYGNLVGITCTISGNSYMLYNNGTTAKVDVGLNGTTSTTTWNVSDAFAIKGDIADNREYILYNPAIEKALQFSNGTTNTVSFGDFDAAVEEVEYEYFSSVTPHYRGVVSNKDQIQRVKLIKNDNGSTYQILPFINGSYGTHYLGLDETGQLTISTSGSVTQWTFEKQSSGKYIISANGYNLGSSSNKTPIANTENVFHTQWYVDCISLYVEKCGQEETTTCGAATSAMILRSLGIDKSEKEYIEKVYMHYSPDEPQPYTKYAFNAYIMNRLLSTHDNLINENIRYKYGFTTNDSNIENSFGVPLSLPRTSSVERYMLVSSSSLSYGFPLNSLVKISDDSFSDNKMFNTDGHFIVTTGLYYNYPRDSSSEAYKFAINEVNYKYIYDDPEKGVGFKHILDTNVLLSYCYNRSAGVSQLMVIAYKHSFYEF